MVSKKKHLYQMTLTSHAVIMNLLQQFLMSNQSERKRQKSKHRSQKKHNSLAEIHAGYDVPFTPKGVAKEEKNDYKDAGFTAFGFDALKLKDALIKIDEYKQGQRMREKEKRLQKEVSLKESLIPLKKEEPEKVSLSVKETPKRHYSSEVVSALLQYKHSSD